MVRLLHDLIRVDGPMVPRGTVLFVWRTFMTTSGWRYALCDRAGNVVLPQCRPEDVEPCL